MAAPGEINFNIFQETTVDNIRVGYISSERGFIQNVNVPDANRYAKKNPGTTFIFNNRDGVRYLNINEVNSLSVKDLSPKKTSSQGNCTPVIGLSEIDRITGVSGRGSVGVSGRGLGDDNYKTRVSFYGGGGVGAKGNPVIGSDGSLLAIDLDSGGFGYKFAPYVKVDDELDIGSGAVIRAILCKIESVTQFFSTEKDFEEYIIPDDLEVGYGRRFNSNGKDVGSWNPEVYANTDKNPFRREIQQYQRYLIQLTKPWWTTRKFAPLSVTSPISRNRTKYDVKHPEWGSEPKGTKNRNENSFMNKYAISPVPATNRRGSDFAGIPYTFEWQENFPIDGEYVFNGACDNKAQLYLDSSKVMDLGGFRSDGTKLKKFMKSGVHKIRLDLYNIPIKERVQKVVSDEGCPTNIDFKITTSANFANSISIPGLNIDLGKKQGGPQLRAKFNRSVERGKEYSVTVRSPQSKNIKLRTKSGGSVLQVEESTDNDWQDLVCSVSCGRFIKINGNKCKLIFDAPKVSEIRTIVTSSTTTQGESKLVFNTLDYIGRANRRLWKMNPGSGRGSDFINLYGVLPFDPGKKVASTRAVDPKLKFEKKGDKLFLKVTGSGRIKATLEMEVDDNPRTAGVAANEIKIETDDRDIILNRTRQRQVVTGRGEFTAGKEYLIRVIGGARGSRSPDVGRTKIGLKDAHGNDNNINLRIKSTNVIRTENDYPNTSSDSFAGVHVIDWNNIDFPIDGNYVIDTQVDDNVNIIISNKSGGVKDTVIKKRGFSSPGKSTGKSSYVRYFVKGKYSLKAELEQIPGKGLSNGNPMGVAINISTAGQGEEVVAAKSWMDNPMGVSLTIDAPLPPIPQEPIPAQEGRCPNNPIWTTRFPGATSRWWPVVDTLGRWGKFQDRYAISPVPPLGIKSTDNGGVNFINSWSIDIPYEGFYGVQGTVDNSGKVLIDGKEVLGRGTINGFKVDNPSIKKIFLSEGRHTIQVEVENFSQQLTKKIEQQVFRTADWAATTNVSSESKEVNVTFKINSDASFANRIKISELGIDVSKRNKGKQINSKLDKKVKSGKVYHVEVSSPQSNKVKLRGRGSVLQTEESTDEDWSDLTCAASKGRFFDFKEGKSKATCKFVVGGTTKKIKGGTKGGSTKKGVTYSGPVLSTYANSSLGPFLTPAFKGPDDYKNNFQGKTWTMKWSNVDFPVRGRYTVKAVADDILTIKVDGVEVSKAKVFEGVSTAEFSSDAGKKTIELVLENANIPDSTFENNPTVAACVISTKVDVSDGTQSWKSNPMGISAVLIPPPCPKEIRGQGVVCRVIVDDPGNGYQAPPGEGYPVALKLKSIEVENPGINYNCGVDEIIIEPSNGAILDYDCDPFGKIRSVKILDGGFGFTQYPEISMVGPLVGPLVNGERQATTGVNAKFRPQFEVVRDPIVIDQDKLIQVVDLIGLQQTGYVEGRPYYGAVFYKNEVRYAGYYETPGDLVQVYDTLQESIDQTTTTKPSAIQRQGTNIQSNDPRLNIPGTPENLI